MPIRTSHTLVTTKHTKRKHPKCVHMPICTSHTLVISQTHTKYFHMPIRTSHTLVITQTHQVFSHAHSTLAHTLDVQVAEHKVNMDKLPLEEASHMPAHTAASILHRVGGFIVLPPPPLPPPTSTQPIQGLGNEGTGSDADGTSGVVVSGTSASLCASNVRPTPSRRHVRMSSSQGQTSAPARKQQLVGGAMGVDSRLESCPSTAGVGTRGAAGVQGAGCSLEGGEGGARGKDPSKATPTDVFLQLHDVTLQHRLGTVPQLDVYHSQHAQVTVTAFFLACPYPFDSSVSMPESCPHPFGPPQAARPADCPSLLSGLSLSIRQFSQHACVMSSPFWSATSCTPS